MASAVVSGFNPSTVWAQLALPLSPAGSVPYVAGDTRNIHIDPTNFVYEEATATLSLYGCQEIVDSTQIPCRTGKAVVTPVDGFAYTFPSLQPANAGSNAAVVDTVIFTPAGLLAGGTVTAALQPIDGQEMRILASGFGITSLTVLANTGQTLIAGAAFTLAANTEARWLYHAVTNTWYKE